jgi:hypothetical protein
MMWKRIEFRDIRVGMIITPQFRGKPFDGSNDAPINDLDIVERIDNRTVECYGFNWYNLPGEIYFQWLEKDF